MISHAIPVSYTHLFLKFASDKFEECRNKIIATHGEKYADMKPFYTDLLLCNFAARFISRDQDSTVLTEIKDYGQKKNDKKNNSSHAYDLHSVSYTHLQNNSSNTSSDMSCIVGCSTLESMIQASCDH